MRHALAVLLMLATLAIPATGARAQSNPFGPLPQSAQATPAPAPTATPDAAADGGPSRGLMFAIAAGVALLFVGIGYFITRDARAHLTADDRRALEHERTEAERRRGSVVKSRARARGKAQRRARKAQRRR